MLSNQFYELMVRDFLLFCELLIQLLLSSRKNTQPVQDTLEPVKARQPYHDGTPYRCSVLFFTILLATSCVSRNGGSIEESSNYSVGYKVYHVFDSTRTFTIPDSLHLPNNFRPMQVSVWYPIAEKSGPKMPYKSYLYSILTEEHFRDVSQSEKQEILLAFKQSARTVFRTIKTNEQTLDSLLDSSTMVLEDAKIAKGSFPLVIYAPGNDPGGTYGSSMENSLLFELLASNGYVVASVPSYRGRQFSEASNTVQSQALDQEFLLRWMKNNAYIDSSKVASMAYSFGGVGQIIHAHNNPEIKAIVSLESGVTFKEIYERLHTYEEYQDILPESFEQPFLHFASTPLWKGNWSMSLNQTFIEKYHGDSYLARFFHAGHRDFASDQIYTVALAQKDGDSVPGTIEFPIVNRKKSMQAYNAMGRVVLRFLNAQFAKPEENSLKIAFDKELRETITIDTFNLK